MPFRRTKIVIVGLALIWGFDAFAEIHGLCEARLAPPPEIVRTPQPLYALEKDEAGQVLNQGQQVGSLADGRYVYVLAADGRLAYAPKYDYQSFMQSRKGLATHKNLIDKLGPGTSYLAAGEFIVAFGQAVALNNRSGNLRGQTAHLDYASVVLPEFGIVLTVDAHKRDFTPKHGRPVDDGGHSPEDRNKDEFYLELMARSSVDPVARELTEIYQELVKILIPFSKTKTPAGVTELIYTAATEGNFGGEIYTAYPIRAACTVDGLAFGIENSMKGRNLLVSIDATLRGLKIYLRERSNPQDRKRLDALISRVKTLYTEARKAKG